MLGRKGFPVAHKSEKPVYAFILKGTHLVPEMEHDAKALAGIAEGERVKVEIRQWRNYGRLRAYWAMLGEVVEATGCAPSAEKLHEVVKLENGFVDLVRLGKMTVAIPGSIAFDKMTETDMVAFFRTAEQFLAQHYGYVPQERAA